MSRVMGIATLALVVLGTIYAFNRFSGKNVATFGAKA